MCSFCVAWIIGRHIKVLQTLYVFFCFLMLTGPARTKKVIYVTENTIMISACIETFGFMHNSIASSKLCFLFRMHSFALGCLERQFRSMHSASAGWEKRGLDDDR